MKKAEENVFELRKNGAGEFRPFVSERPASPTGLFKIRLVSICLAALFWWYGHGAQEVNFGILALLLLLAAIPLTRLKKSSAILFYFFRLVEGILGLTIGFTLGFDRVEAFVLAAVLAASPIDDIVFTLPVYVVIQVGAWVVMPAKTLWNHTWESGGLYYELRESFFDACDFPGAYLRSMREGKMREFLAERAKAKMQQYLLPPRRAHPSGEEKDRVSV